MVGRGDSIYPGGINPPNIENNYVLFWKCFFDVRASFHKTVHRKLGWTATIGNNVIARSIFNYFIINDTTQCLANITCSAVEF